MEINVKKINKNLNLLKPTIIITFFYNKLKKIYKKNFIININLYETKKIQ